MGTKGGDFYAAPLRCRMAYEILEGRDGRYDPISAF